MSKLKNGIKNIRIGPIGEAVLVTLALGSAVTIIAIFPGLSLLLTPFVKKRKTYQPREVRRSIDALIKNGLVKKSLGKDGEDTFELTKKGRWEAALRHGTFTLKPKRNWDKIWRIVIFDVPNSKNADRRSLRRALRMYGFKLIQKSVWVYPHECDDFINLIKSNLGVSADVLYMKASYIENDMQLRREFKIK